MPVDFKQYPILFVDDEPQNLVVLRYALDDYFTVFTAGSGKEGLALLDKHKFAVVLSDQRMPGMTGVEFCALARERQPDAVRIIITAYADIHTAIDAINLGQVSRYLLKPWQNEELIEVLQTAIEFVHLQMSMQDMELRLLQVGQQRIASAVHDEMLHEIANPLGAMTITISRASEILNTVLHRVDSQDGRGQVSLKDELLELREVHDDALAAIRQLTALTTRMRSGPRVLPPTGLCDAATVVETTLRIVRHEIERVARLRVVIEQAPMVPVDSSALGQIVLNLVLNAAQAIKGCGVEDRTILIKVHATHEAAFVSVIDDGPGITQEHLDRIFEPGFTTKSTGSGLGLSIVREMVRRLGGEIVVRSIPQSETTFEVRLPLP